MARQGGGGSASLDFSDGDTLKRFTITDPGVPAGATIIPAIQRSAALADVDDPGWIYIPNVVTVNPNGGSFDVLVAALAGDSIAGRNEFPKEVITLTYIID